MCGEEGWPLEDIRMNFRGLGVCAVCALYVAVLVVFQDSGDGQEDPDWTLEKDPVQTHSGCVVLWSFWSDVACGLCTSLH